MLDYSLQQHKLCLLELQHLFLMNLQGLLLVSVSKGSREFAPFVAAGRVFNQQCHQAKPRMQSVICLHEMFSALLIDSHPIPLCCCCLPSSSFQDPLDVVPQTCRCLEEHWGHHFTPGHHADRGGKGIHGLAFHVFSFSIVSISLFIHLM